MSRERLVRQALEDSVRDLAFAEPDVDELVAAGRSMRRRRVGVVASLVAAAVMVLVLAGTALWRTELVETLPAAPSLTAADLAGVWMVNETDSSGHLWHFTADGRRTTTNTPEEYLALEQDLEPISIGAADVLTIPALGNDCRGTVQLGPEGTMTLTPLGGATACKILTSDEEWRLIRVSPMSPAGAALTGHPNPKPSTPTAAPADMSELAGTWLLRGTGTLLVVRDSSSNASEYVLDDDGDVPTLADQRGTATLRPDGGLVLHPTKGGEQGCDTVYERVLTTGNTLKADLAATSCGRPGGVSGTWIRLS
jgi:hypothetical protein